MDIYFDESRNTGELGFNETNNILNYSNQRYGSESISWELFDRI